MEDLIVIILTLIVVVVGAIGQIKRKNQPQPENKQQNSADNFWGLLNETETEAPIVENTSEIIETVTITEKKAKPKYTFSAKNEGESVIEKDFPLLKDDITFNQEKKRERIAKTFSLKKAIIYSEILNRKYS